MHDRTRSHGVSIATDHLTPPFLRFCREAPALLERAKSANLHETFGGECGGELRGESVEARFTFGVGKMVFCPDSGFGCPLELSA
jgi:hypothetical protein